MLLYAKCSIIVPKAVNHNEQSQVYTKQTCIIFISFTCMPHLACTYVSHNNITHKQKPSLPLFSKSLIIQCQLQHLKNYQKYTTKRDCVSRLALVCLWLSWKKWQKINRSSSSSQVVALQTCSLINGRKWRDGWCFGVLQ